MIHKEVKLKKNPIESVNVFNKLCYWWIIGIFYKGVSRDPEMKDLYEPANCERSEILGDQLEREWNKELAKKKKLNHYKPSLLWCITRVFFWTFMFNGVLLFAQHLIFLNLQTIFLGWLILYFDSGSSSAKNEAFCYATGIIVMVLSAVIAGNQACLGLERIGMRIRIACCSLVYRKTMRLSKASLGQTTGGQIINLLSNDVQRFDTFPLFLHYIWIMPIQMIVGSYIIWQDVGVATLVGVTACALQAIPVPTYISTLSAKLRGKIAEQTDKRVQAMNEIICEIQMIKMYNWEKYFEKIVNDIRKIEMKLISLASYCRAFYLSINLFAERVSVFATLLTLILTGNQINTKTVFTMSIYWKLLQFLMAACFPQAVACTGETLVSIRRLEEYLQLEELAPNAQHKSAKKGVANYRTGITTKNLSATWLHDGSQPTLVNLNFEVRHGQLCALLGPIGSGKSSILQLVLGELPVGNGTLNVQGTTISYVAQEAWLFEGTIKDNILFGLPYVKNKYDEVKKVCALNIDFQQLPQRDLTYVGERGASLSGGQRARISLARAVYRDADIYLIDDPFSAVDTRVGSQIFEDCIKGYLYGKTRILITHHLQFLEQTDLIIVIKNGSVQAQGTYEYLTSTESNFADMANSIRLEEEESKVTLTRLSSMRKSISLHPIILGPEPIEDNPECNLNKEKSAVGRMSFKILKQYFKAGGNVCLRGSVVLAMLLCQVTASGVDYWSAFWIRQEFIKRNPNCTDSSTYLLNDDYNKITSPPNCVERIAWLTTATSVAIYAVIILSCVISALLRNTLFLQMCTKSSKTLHQKMFENLMQAPMQFFNTNPSGRILNRFSEDVGSMDETLPRSILETIALFSMVLGSLTMLIIGNYWMIIPMIFFCATWFVARNCYISLAQGLKRLEAVAKSPMYSHINCSLEGLLTIRSSKSQRNMIKEFDDCQNFNTSASFMCIATANAFGFYMNVVTLIFIAIVCFTFVILNDETTMPVKASLAVSQSLSLGEVIQFGIRESIKMASKMTSIERVLQYTNIPKEGPFVSTRISKPPSTWPQFGAIDMQNLTLKYVDEGPAVLKDINIHIGPRQKIGIVGRTGAGKSSLIAALFRFAKLEGSLTIDGIDIQTIGLNDLRSKISIIPQDPTLFNTTLRHNLDPFHEFSDDYLWATLDELELRRIHTSLDFEITEGGSNLSLGERQLLCLARAILKNNKIVVLDEATANLDSSTEFLIQATVRRKFTDCTVLTIAHRLGTVVDNDRILVLDAGRVVEFDHPYILLQNPSGYFSKMVKGNGAGSAEQLIKTAKLAFEEYR